MFYPCVFCSVYNQTFKIYTYCFNLRICILRTWHDVQGGVFRSKNRWLRLPHKLMIHKFSKTDDHCFVYVCIWITFTSIIDHRWLCWCSITLVHRSSLRRIKIYIDLLWASKFFVVNKTIWFYTFWKKGNVQNLK